MLALAILTGCSVPLPARPPHSVQIVSTAMRFSSNHNFLIQVNTCILRFLHLESMKWWHVALMTWNFLAHCAFKYQDLSYSSFLPNPHVISVSLVKSQKQNVTGDLHVGGFLRSALRNTCKEQRGAGPDREEVNCNLITRGRTETQPSESGQKQRDSHLPLYRLLFLLVNQMFARLAEMMLLWGRFLSISVVLGIKVSRLKYIKYYIVGHTYTLVYLST